MQPLEIALLGAGGRGTFAYGRYAELNPHLVRFVAVAEPNEERRERFRALHGIPAERCFASWEELLAGPQLAEALLNATMDRMHVASTLAALDGGYQVLLEKPMAVTPEECVRLVLAAEERGRILQICHVLRYTQFLAKLHEIVQSGRLGRVINVDHRENVAYWHMAHSFVRGNWRSAGESSPMILAKCCHDMDILHWILGSPVRKLTSFGRLLYYCAENAPEGAPARCTDGCPAQETCPFYAPAFYLSRGSDWPTSALGADTSPEGVLRALREGPYGRCVFRCDNDVVDNQVINMELESDATITFTMQGHSHNNVRTVRYDGTRATLLASEATDEIAIHDHLTGSVETFHPGRVDGGHGGGDGGIMRDFVATVRGGPRQGATTARASLESHLMAFASEQARVEGSVLDMAAYRQQIEARALNQSLDLA
jgi:predicted dehydrogenase